MPRKTSASYVAAIKANVDDWFADRIRYKTYASRQAALWRTIEQRPGILRRVTKALALSLTVAPRT